MQKLLKSVLLSLLALIFLCGMVYSQITTTGAIEGNVKDPEGNPLPGVKVVLSSPGLIGGAQTKITDPEGKFRFIGLMTGVYTIEASLQGFVTMKREDINLHIGQTLTVTMEMKIATLAEEVTVTAISPLIDVKDSAVGKTNLDKDFMLNIPNASRRLSYMINQAPGVWGNSGFGGNGRAGNSYTIDGIESRYTKSGIDWPMVDFNIFDELQITGLGANVEFDGFSGIATNSVTKSGGNQFDGYLEFVYGNWGWTAKNFDPTDKLFSLYKAPPKTAWFDVAGGIGGRFIRDKLWFFASFRWPRNQSQIVGMSEISSVEKPAAFIKLTFQASNKLRLHAWAEHDVYYNKNTGLGVLDPPITCSVEDGWTNLYNISALYSFSERTILEARFFVNDVPYWNEAKNGETPGRVDNLTGMSSVNNNWTDDTWTGRYETSATLSHHADEFIKGSHDFKFGVDFEVAPAWDKYWYPGGVWYRDNVWAGGKFHTYAYEYSYSFEETFLRFSAFAQDSWKISDNLTINPGLRFNWYKAWNTEIDLLTHRGWVGPPTGLQPAFFATAFVPRIGFTWDIFGDHSTAVKAHYGKYTNGMLHNYYIEAAKTGISDWVMYDVLPDKTRVEIFRANYSNPATVDSDIKFPVMDQFTAGLERELFKDTSLGVTFIWRKWKNFIARVNTGATWKKTAYSFKDEKGVQQTMDVYYKTSKGAADKFYITNPSPKYASCIDEPKSRYMGLMFSLTKRMSNNWMLNASYTYMNLKGTEMGGSSRMSQWVNPNSQIYGDGWLGYDIPHQLKIYSTFILPLDFLVSPTFQYIRAYNWTRTVRAPSATGVTSVRIEERGSNRYDPFFNFDIRLEKFLTIGNTRLEIQADVFNLFNRGVPTSLESRVDRTTYGLATGVNTARVLRIGIRFLY
jgi:hypothetical protein